MKLSKVIVIMLITLSVLVSATSAGSVYYQKEKNVQPVSPPSEDSLSPVSGIWWDTSLWQIAVPPDTIQFFVCWQDSSEKSHCIPLPQGFVMFLPLGQY